MPTKKQVTEATPEEPVRVQPTRRVEAPPRSEFDASGRTLEADTSQPVRSSGKVTSSILAQDTMAQLRAGAEANGIELPSVEEPVEISDEGEVTPVEEARPNVTRVQDVQSPPYDPRAPIPVFTDKRKAPTVPKTAERTRIAVGPIDEAIVTEERMVRIKPKTTCQRWIGPWRYHFTKDVVCEVPESVRDALLREELIVPYYH
jgi:hypothetical protein